MAPREARICAEDTNIRSARIHQVEHVLQPIMYTAEVGMGTAQPAKIEINLNEVSS